MQPSGTLCVSPIVEKKNQSFVIVRKSSGNHPLNSEEYTC